MTHVSGRQVVSLVEAYMDDDGNISLDGVSDIIHELMNLHITMEYGSVEAYEEHIGKTYDFADVMSFLEGLDDHEEG